MLGGVFGLVVAMGLPVPAVGKGTFERHQTALQSTHDAPSTPVMLGGEFPGPRPMDCVARV